MLSAVRVAAGPASEPIALADAKAWLRVDHNADDGLIAALLTAARTIVEDYTRRALARQTLEVTYTEPLEREAQVVLPRPPYVGLVSAEYSIDGGAPVSWTPTITPQGDAAAITLADLPDLGGGYARVTYTAGYDVLPDPLRQAVLLTLAALYDGDEEGLPQQARAVAAPWRFAW